MNSQCLFYRTFIDPLLRPLRRKLAALVPPGSSVLEAACGTGEQSLIFSRRAGRVLGFDYNGNIVECAKGRIPELSENLSFQEADARNLPFIADEEFDYASITLALHEMNPANRIPVLKELSRTARNLLIADYASPLPSSISGWFTRMIEKMAGKEHYAGFCNYQDAGGLDVIIEMPAWS
ncbi:MAG: class I SAM-dependent methyltransferase [Spirochaetaceae bacterium]|nr:class I SAM-dependent methyltransferase [Spirochaetaceae bacterium]